MLLFRNSCFFPRLTDPTSVLRRQDAREVEEGRLGRYGRSHTTTPELEEWTWKSLEEAKNCKMEIQPAFGVLWMGFHLDTNMEPKNGSMEKVACGGPSWWDQT